MRIMFLLAVLALSGADVYRWVDANGQVNFSDMPRAGAERITVVVPAPPTAPATAQNAPARGTTENDGSADFSGYDSLTIQSPGQDETLWNIEGQLNVVAAVEPDLRDDHTLQIFLDGQAVQPAEPGSTTVSLSGVYRGQHTLRAQILDSGGASLAESSSVTFFVQQTALGPKNTRARP